MIIDTGRLKEISEIEFGDIVDDVVLTDINEIRIILIDGSFIDVWFSLKLVRYLRSAIFRSGNVSRG